MSDCVYEFDKYHYEFDIHKDEVVADCNLHPTDILLAETEWLTARNDKYIDYDSEKVGKWMIFPPKCRVNATWDKVKRAIASGELWCSKVSTTKPENSTYAIMIYTKDYTDLVDVIHVLNYLESSGLKPPHLTIYYKTDQQTLAGIYRDGEERPWIYCSATIRQRRHPVKRHIRRPVVDRNPTN